MSDPTSPVHAAMIAIIVLNHQSKRPLFFLNLLPNHLVGSAPLAGCWFQVVSMRSVHITAGARARQPTREIDVADALVNTVFALMINGAFALNGLRAMLRTWKL
jgi:hypothetical protein